MVAAGALLTPTSWAQDAKTTDDGRRILFYLHGRIVEDQGLKAASEVFGPYEYEKILEALGREGHEVVSEIRPKNTNPETYAEKIARDIRDLRGRGTPSSHITVVGASKGAAITILVSHLLHDSEINYVLLAICGQQMNKYCEDNGICLSGNVLSFYEESDQTAGSCESLFSRCRDKLGRTEEIALHLGNGHGMVYKPFNEWVEPTLKWAVNRRSRIN